MPGAKRAGQIAPAWTICSQVLTTGVATPGLIGRAPDILSARTRRGRGGGPPFEKITGKNNFA